MKTLWHDREMWTRMLVISFTTADLEKEADSLLQRLHRNQVDIGNALKPYLEKHLFCWDDIPGEDSQKLLEFLFMNYGLRGFEEIKVIKTLDGDNITISSGSTSTSLKLNHERTKVVLEMDINGKLYEFRFKAKTENGRLNIYLDNNESAKVLTSILISNITMSKNLIIAKRSRDIRLGMDAEEALKENATSFAACLCGLNPNYSYKSLEKMLTDYNRLLREVTIARLNNNSDADYEAYKNIQEIAQKIAETLVDGIVKVKQAD